MQSNAEFSAKHKTKPSSYTLTSAFGADDTLKFDDANTPLELKPRPGITSLSSTIKGHLGIMREVNVKFKAYTLPQLELLQDLFMIPGIGVLVEWGWSASDSEILSIDLRKTLPKGESDKWLRETINGNGKKSGEKDYVAGQVRKGGGRYDALFGLVCNFNITFVDDGTWDCDTTIVGPGSMTVDINLKSTGNALDKKLTEFIEKEIKREMSWPGTPMDKGESKYAKCGTFNGIEAKMNLNPSLSEQQQEKLDKDARDSEAKAANKPPPTTAPTAITSNTNMYVTWEFIEYTLNKFFSTEEQSNFAKPFLQSGLSAVDSRIPCNSFSGWPDDGWLWRSFSPTDVLITGHPPSLDAAKEISISVDNTKKEKREIRPFDNFKDESGKALQYGDAGAVWINWNGVVKPAFENSETMQEAINKILNTMNNAAGGIWDLQLMYDGGNYNAYRIVDFKCAYGIAKEAAKPYVFDLNMKNSMVRAAEVSMIIPSALKSTVMIASNAPPGVDLESAVADRDKVGIFKSLTNGVTDRFAAQMKSPSGTPAGLGGGGTMDVQQRKDVRAEKQKSGQDIQDLVKAARAKGWNVELSGEEKSAAINFIFRALEARKSNDGISALIPLDLSITLDGIGGLTWGNAFNVSYLPTKYRENAFFQIKDISHDVSQDGWTTKITGQMRPKYNGTAISLLDARPGDSIQTDGSVAAGKQADVPDTGVPSSVVDFIGNQPVNPVTPRL